MDDSNSIASDALSSSSTADRTTTPTKEAISTDIISSICPTTSTTISESSSYDGVDYGESENDESNLQQKPKQSMVEAMLQLATASYYDSLAEMESRNNTFYHEGVYFEDSEDEDDTEYSNEIDLLSISRISTSLHEMTIHEEVVCEH